MNFSINGIEREKKQRLNLSFPTTYQDYFRQHHNLGISCINWFLPWFLLSHEYLCGLTDRRQKKTSSNHPTSGLNPNNEDTLLQFIDWPLEADSKSKSISIHPQVKILCSRKQTNKSFLVMIFGSFLDLSAGTHLSPPRLKGWQW